MCVCVKKYLSIRSRCNVISFLLLLGSVLVIESFQQAHFRGRLIFLISMHLVYTLSSRKDKSAAVRYRLSAY